MSSLSPIFPLMPFLVCLLTFLLSFSVFAAAQVPNREQLSHVERFNPRLRDERIERERTAVLRTSPDNAAALNDRGVARIHLGRFEEAIDDLQHGAKLNPSSADLRVSLGYALWRNGRPAEAAESFRQALKLDEKHFPAHYYLGRLLLIGGKDVNEAVVHLRRAVEINPEAYEIRFDLIAACRAVGDPVRARAQLRFLEFELPTEPRVLYTAALLAADRGDWKNAIESYRAALRADPRFPGARLELGMALIKSARWTEATEWFAPLAKEQPGSVDLSYLYALSLFNSKQVAAAEAEIRRALRLDAAAAAARTLLGIILLERSENSEAVSELERAVALDAKNFDAQFYLGRARYTLGDKAGAAEVLQKAVDLRPNQIDPIFFLATALEETGNNDAALARYQELVRIAPENVKGHVGLGALLAKMGKYAEADQSLRHALKLDPEGYEAHYALGVALARMTRLEEAIALLQKAALLQPQMPDPHYQLGLALKRMGKEAEAQREFETVDKLNAEFRMRSKTMK